MSKIENRKKKIEKILAKNIKCTVRVVEIDHYALLLMLVTLETSQFNKFAFIVFF